MLGRRRERATKEYKWGPAAAERQKKGGEGGRDKERAGERERGRADPRIPSSLSSAVGAAAAISAVSGTYRRCATQSSRVSVRGKAASWFRARATTVPVFINCLSSLTRDKSSHCDAALDSRTDRGLITRVPIFRDTRTCCASPPRSRCVYKIRVCVCPRCIYLVARNSSSSRC